MKDLVTKIYESDDFNPSFDSHKKAYNNFVKWYDKCLKSMNKEEILDLVKSAIKEILTGERDAVC